MLAGLDTGFFYLLFNNDTTAVKIWNEKKLITSVIVIYELQKKLLKGEFSSWPSIISDIEKVVKIIPVTLDIAKKASHISRGTDMPALDSLILSSLLEAECKEIYTTDSHIVSYNKKGVKIVLLSEKELKS
jgi:predicted nucleic acid-binding protein